MTDEREDALDEMHRATVELIKLIEIEKRCTRGGLSWHAVEVAFGEPASFVVTAPWTHQLIAVCIPPRKSTPKRQ